MIKVNIGSAPQFELIRSASSFWHSFCGFEPTLFCLDPVPPSWIKTLSIYGPLTGSLVARFGFITLSCSSLNSVCIALSLSRSLQVSPLSVWITSYLTSCFLFRSGVLCFVCSSLITELSTWTDEERLMKPTWHLSKLFPLTYLPCFFSPLSFLCVTHSLFLQRGFCESVPAVVSILSLSFSICILMSHVC